jgi:hypothetical protein
MSRNLSAQFVFPSPKVLDFNEKRLHWASVVRGERYRKDYKVTNCKTLSNQKHKAFDSSSILFYPFEIKGNFI